MKYLLMHKRTAVLKLDIDKLGMIAKIGAVSAPEHLPVGVRTSKSGVDRASFNEWWADRCIPASRSGVRDALQALGYPLHYEEAPGLAHEWDFWDRYVRKALYEWLPLKRAAVGQEK